MNNIISSRVLLFILLSTIVGTGVFWLIRDNVEKEAKLKRTKTEQTFDVADVTENDLIWGNPQARLTIIQYSDLQCPACALYHKIISSTKRLVENDVRIIFRHFPLMSIHPHARLAAEYIEAARFQQKHMELIDLFYEKQREWSKAPNPEKFFLKYAKEVGANIKQLKKDKKKPEVLEKVKSDIMSGNKAGINATPSFFLDKKRLQFPRTPQAFFQFVQEKKKQMDRNKQF